MATGCSKKCCDSGEKSPGCGWDSRPFSSVYGAFTIVGAGFVIDDTNKDIASVVNLKAVRDDR